MRPQLDGFQTVTRAQCRCRQAAPPRTLPEIPRCRSLRVMPAQVIHRKGCCAHAPGRWRPRRTPHAGCGHEFGRGCGTVCNSLSMPPSCPRSHAQVSLGVGSHKLPGKSCVYPEVCTNTINQSVTQSASQSVLDFLCAAAPNDTLGVEPNTCTQYLWTN